MQGVRQGGVCAIGMSFESRSHGLRHAAPRAPHGRAPVRSQPAPYFSVLQLGARGLLHTRLDGRPGWPMARANTRSNGPGSWQQASEWRPPRIRPRRHTDGPKRRTQCTANTLNVRVLTGATRLASGERGDLHISARASSTPATCTWITLCLLLDSPGAPCHRRLTKARPAAPHYHPPRRLPTLLTHTRLRSLPPTPASTTNVVLPPHVLPLAHQRLSTATSPPLPFSSFTLLLSSPSPTPKHGPRAAV